MWRTIVLGLAALASACSTIVPRDTGPPPPPPTEAPRPVTPRPMQPGIPEDNERHRVALLVPLTGANGAVGRSLANATQLALLDTRNEQIRVTTYDTALGAPAAAQRAIADGARLILGPLLADDVRSVAPIARRAGVPVLSFSNDAGVAGNGAYLMGYAPAQSIERVVDYAKRSGISQFAGLMPSGLYGERASTAFLRAVERSGGSVTSVQTYDRSAGSITAAVGRMRGTPYQAILIADSAGTASLAVPALRRSGGAGARVLGTELWNADAAIGRNAALQGAWFASVSDSLYRQYATKYRARFGAAPYRLSSLGYDAVLLTVRIARDWRVGDNFPERRLTDSDGFAGLDGAFRFTRDGIAERALEVQEIKGGTTTTVSPAPQGFGR
ncbi:penicillin-binding protein activator [Sphingomonas donggukensis]|uniref:Penicillin-binding protein activator n=2 Tax=Sphingomonas donggukensis TaxID=2949093 RepID=A0ABY4TW58_9SPHN|nr:penicillin-binding protein activator [Sphingomonas donggukensis]URW74766.1 penicillin-binding protein activator [Sphingomonas donggukensis]